MLAVIIGATRSGKSAIAEEFTAQCGASVTYVAAGAGPHGLQHDDPELAQRIARHQLRRPSHWRTLEEDPLTALNALDPSSTVLIDSLGSWLAALLDREGLWTDASVAPLTEEEKRGVDRLLARVETFAHSASVRPGAAVVVAELAGAGLIPSGAGARRWLDLLGEATQLLVRRAEPAIFVVAGRALRLPPPDAAPSGLVEPCLQDELHSREQRPESSSAAQTSPLAMSSPLTEQTAALRFHGDELGRGVSAQGMTLDFAVSVYPGSPPRWMQAALQEGIVNSTRYPDEKAARKAIARRHGRDPDEVLLAAGSAELFWLLAHVLKPRNPVCVHPTFTEAEMALRTLGAPPTRILRHARTFALIPGAIPTASDFVVVTNPNNPTGNVDPADLIAPLARNGRTLVIDEAFMEFDPGERESLTGRTDLPGLVVLRTLTKLWSIPGIRAGYLLGPAPLVARLRAARPSWTVSTPAIAALRAWADARADVAEYRCAEVTRRRAGFAQRLAALPSVEVWPSGANFLLVRMPQGEVVRHQLAARGVLVRPGWTFPGLSRDYLRIAVRTDAEHCALLGHLDAVLRATASGVP